MSARPSRIVYRCVFIFQGQRREVVSPDGLIVFSHGFWIDANWQLARGSEARFWIPPGQIEFVARDVK